MHGIAKHIPLYVTTLSNQSISHKELVAEKDFGLIMGNEYFQVSPLLRSYGRSTVHIEMPGRVFENDASKLLMFSSYKNCLYEQFFMIELFGC